MHKRQRITGKLMASTWMWSKASAKGKHHTQPKTPLNFFQYWGSTHHYVSRPEQIIYLLRWASDTTGHMSERNGFIFKHYKHTPKHSNAHIWKILKSWDQPEKSQFNSHIKSCLRAITSLSGKRGETEVSLYISNPLPVFISLGIHLPSLPFPSCKAPYHVGEVGKALK